MQKCRQNTHIQHIHSNCWTVIREEDTTQHSVDHCHCSSNPSNQQPYKSDTPAVADPFSALLISSSSSLESWLSLSRYDGGNQSIDRSKPSLLSVQTVSFNMHHTTILHSLEVYYIHLVFCCWALEAVEKTGGKKRNKHSGKEWKINLKKKVKMLKRKP
jgi:hypothetical protein